MLAEAHNGELLGQMCPNVCPDFQWIVGCRAGCSKRKSFRFGHPGTEQIQQLHRLENTVALLFLSGQMGKRIQNAWVQGVSDRAMHPFFAAIFRLTLRVSSLIPREEQTAARLSLAALASTAIKMPPRFPLYRHQRRGELSESRKIPGACTVQDVPCSGWTINRPDKQKNTSKWSGAPHTGMDCSSWSVSGKEKRQICTPGILLLQRLASDLWINKYSFNMVFHDLFLLDQTGGLSGHADRRGSLL